MACNSNNMVYDGVWRRLILWANLLNIFTMQQKCCRAPILLWVKFLDRQKWKCLIIRIPQQELVMPFTSIKSSNNACSRQLKMFWWKNHDDVDTKCLHTFVFIFISWQQNSFQSGPPDKRLWSSGLHNTGLSRTHKSSKFWVFLHSSHQAFSFFPLICWLAVFRGIMLHPPGGSNSGVNLVK